MTNKQEQKEIEMQLSEINLDDEQIKEKKMQLEQCKMNKDDTDVQLMDLQLKLDERIPEILLDEKISQIKEDIKNGIFRITTQNGENTRVATLGEQKLSIINLKTLQEIKKRDLQMKDLRFQINALRERKAAIDAPEKQIKKLEREIRERRATIPTPRPKKIPTGVNQMVDSSKQEILTPKQFYFFISIYNNHNRDSILKLGGKHFQSPISIYTALDRLVEEKLIILDKGKKQFIITITQKGRDFILKNS